MRKIDTASFYCFAIFVLVCMSVTTSHGQETPLFEWTKHIGGTLGENAKKMQVDGSRNVYITGQFGGTVDFDPGTGNTNLTSAGGNDIFVCKFDENGNLIWAKSFGSTNSEYVNDIEIDNAGNVHLTGYFDATVDFDPGAGTFNVTPNGAEDAYILKLDNNGNLAWAGTVGGTNYDEGVSIDTDNSGNVFVTGFFLNTADFNPGAAVFNLTSAGQTDSFILKLDNSGNFVWARAFGGTEIERGHTVAIDASGNIISTGGFYGYTTAYDFDPGAATVTLTPSSVVSQWDIYVCKMNPVNGDITWAQSIAGTLWDIDQEIFIDNSDNILLTGYHQGTTDFDPGPATFDLTASGLSNAFALKLNSSGDFIWAKTIGGTGTASNRGDGIVADNTGNVYVSTGFQNTTDLDPGPGTFSITAKGQSDIGVIKLDAAGNFVWAYSIGGTGGEAGFSIAVDNVNKIYLTGIFGLTADFDPGACTFNLTSGGFVDTFLQKMTVGPAPVPPTISSFTPASGLSGTSVIISGTNFSTTPASNVVAFNGTAAVVTASTVTSITTTVPPSATMGKISVTVSCMTVQSATNFTIGATLVPTITSFSPGAGPVGTSVTITGTNFSTSPVNNTVSFNGTTSTVTASSATSITTTVPPSATTGKITVTVAGNTATSAANFTVTTGIFPTITSFSPSSGPVGNSITITGTNFSTTPANNTVMFNGTTASVTASSSTSITTTVPSNATTGKITVTIAGNTATSATDFVITAPGITVNPQPASTAVCTGATATFTLTAGGAANLLYQWQKFNGSVFIDISNGGGYTGATSSTLTINTTGNIGGGEYRCKVSGDAVTDIFSSTVELAVTTVVAAITGDKTTLTASNGDSYQWYAGGVALAGAMNKTYEYSSLEYGSYVVVVSKNGCSDTSDEFVYLITANEVNDHGLKIYPNPFSDHISIELPSAEKSEIKIVDVLGRPVKRYSLNENAMLKLSDLSNGSYVISISRGTRNFCFRLIKLQ